jgi:hypothetical protein
MNLPTNNWLSIKEIRCVYAKQTTFAKSDCHFEDGFIGFVLNSQYNNIYCSNGKLTGLLELLLVDQSSSDDPLYYKMWGEQASCQYRFCISQGAIVALHDFTVHTQYDDKLVIKDVKNIECFPNDFDINLYNTPSNRSNRFIVEFTNFLNWIDLNPYFSMIRFILNMLDTIISKINIANKNNI